MTARSNGWVIVSFIRSSVLRTKSAYSVIVNRAKGGESQGWEGMVGLKWEWCRENEETRSERRGLADVLDEENAAGTWCWNVRYGLSKFTWTSNLHSDRNLKMYSLFDIGLR